MQTNKPYRELTVASLLGGIVVGAILNMGIVFAGLQIGFTIVGSTVGAILGFGLLRGILRRGSILEVNIFQTIASSVNTVNSGIIFTVPVLFLLGLQDRLDTTRWQALAAAAIAGSLLGVVLIIPLRKQIIEYERLRFPSAVAVATILKSPGAGVQKAMLLFVGVAISMTVTFCTLDWGLDWTDDSSWLIRFASLDWLQGIVGWTASHTGAEVGNSIRTILPGDVNVGKLFDAPAGFRLVFAVSLLSFGAGYIAGRPGLVVLYGTILNYWLLIPICIRLGWVPAEFAGFEFSQLIPAGQPDAGSPDYGRAQGLADSFRGFTANKVGIGMILGGAIAGIVVALPALKAALASLRGSGGGGRREEVPFSVLNVGSLVGIALMLYAAYLAGGDAGLGWGTAAILTIAGIAWLWLAGLVVAQTTGRTDWSPISGLSLIAIAIFMGILKASGFDITQPEPVIIAVTLGSAICVAASMCADMMADLKTGYLVGGRPLKQQVAQIATTWIGPGISLLTVWILWEAYRFGPEQAKFYYEKVQTMGPDAIAAFQNSGGTIDKLPEGVPALGAPQAGALQAAIDIVQSGDVPLGKYLTGLALGLFVSLLVSPGLGVMVGLSLYLPFEYMIVFGLGGITAILCRAFFGRRFVEHKGVPLAAGLIVGDALVGIINAITKVVQSL